MGSSSGGLSGIGDLFGGSGGSSGIGSLFGGGGSGGAGSGLGSILGGEQNLAGLETGYGSNIAGPAYSQYISGVTGVQTPADQALEQATLGQMDTATNTNWANLGEPGSTMNTQGLNSNAMNSLAQQVGINALNEQLGQQGLNQALSYFNSAGTNLSSSGTLTNQAQQNQNQQVGNLISALSGLGNKAAGAPNTSTTPSTSTGGGTTSTGGTTPLPAAQDPSAGGTVTPQVT